jgi:energy-coupling factor transporter ATP-binding protein EcfA2
MQAVVEIERLSKLFSRRIRGAGLRGLAGAYFRPRTEQVVAVRDLDLRMESGESLALIGPNGAGKSTTIKILTWILHPTAGTVRVLGLVPGIQGESILDPEPAHESEPYSVPNATTGSSAAARRAGRIPLANPTTRLTPSASNTEPSGVRTGSAGMNR